MAPFFRPKQSLGQNFLTDLNIASKLVKNFELLPSDIVLEIGPGLGILTDLMIDKVFHLYCVEIDQRCMQVLKQRFENRHLTLYHADILKFDLESICTDQKIRIVGNIPYHITSPILFRIIESRERVRDLTLLVQREVADRIVAPAGCKAYGILSVLSQAVADTEILLNVPKTVFKPRPKIDSALIRWTFKENQSIKSYDFLRKIVRQGFSKRRKMLRNSLSEYEKQINFDFTQRPEQLTVLQWIKLANRLMD
ncbi:ribosomal RNA small subunit methyltransferase A [candidate division KSB1 bacterium]|nr:ribosomal RNA small subunit methyltransferase A [candidate division KSB1 bacterium]